MKNLKCACGQEVKVNDQCAKVICSMCFQGTACQEDDEIDKIDVDQLVLEAPTE